MGDISNAYLAPTGLFSGGDVGEGMCSFLQDSLTFVPWLGVFDHCGLWPSR